MGKKGLIAILSSILLVLVIVITVVAVTANPNDSSQNVSSSEQSSVESQKESVRLDLTTAKMEIYSVLQLNASCENYSGMVEWRSSDTSVLSVSQTGRVNAVGLGSATVTAVAGQASATCSVTVTTGDTAPAMSLSVNDLSLRKGDSFTVDVDTTWKNLPINSLNYVWESVDNSNFVTLTLENNGKLATFTALENGICNYTVSTKVNGFTLVQELSVRVVDNDVYFEVENLSAGESGYFAELALIERDSHVKSVTPKIQVFDSGVQINDATFEWQNSNPEVAIMGENGSITALNAGVTVFSARVTANGKTAPLNFTVKVYAPEFVYQKQTVLEVDLNSTDSNVRVGISEISKNIKGSFSHVTIEGVLTDSSSYESSSVLFDRATLGNIYGKRQAQAVFEQIENGITVAIEKVNFTLDTFRGISNKNQLNNIKNYVQTEGNDAYGHFKLLNNVDMGGATLEGLGTYINTGVGWIADYSFKGTFDGQGYTVSNVVESGTNSGLFCSLASGGIVKNVKFVNVTLKGDTGFISTSNVGGIIENVFVYGKIQSITGSAGIPPSMLVSKNEGTVKECVVMVNENSLTDYGAMVVGQNRGTVSNCVAINLSSRALYAVGSTAIKGISNAGECGVAGVFGKSYSDYTLYRTETLEYGYDDWAQGILTEVINANKGASLKVDEIPIDSTAQISIKNSRFVSNYQSDNVGVSAKNGIITVGKDAVLGENATVKVTFIDGSYQELNFKIVKEIIKLDKTFDLDLRKPKVSIDLKKYATRPGSTIEWVTLGATTLSGATLNNGVLTLYSNMFGKGKNDWGKISVNVKTDREIFNVPLFVYVSIASPQDFDTLFRYAYLEGLDVYENGGRDTYGYFMLTDDIDMAYFPYNSAVFYYSGSLKSWSRILYGTIDGNGHTIYNLAPEIGDNGGLFPCIGETGVVKNLILKSASNTRSALIATENNGRVENIFIEGSIVNGGSSGIPAGMLVSKNNGTVTNCAVILRDAPDAEISYGAMLVGRDNSGGKITNCIAINASKKVVYAVGTNSKTVAQSGEQAVASNRVYSSFNEYQKDRENINVCTWALEIIDSFIEE